MTAKEQQTTTQEPERKQIQALGAVFLDKEGRIMLLRRTAKRTFDAGKLDIMGGDMLEGETPEQALQRDAVEKLHVKDLQYEYAGIATSHTPDAVITRHMFVCTGDYSQLTIDTSKYDPDPVFMNAAQVHKEYDMKHVRGDANLVVLNLALKGKIK